MGSLGVAFKATVLSDSSITKMQLILRSPDKKKTKYNNGFIEGDQNLYSRVVQELTSEGKWKYKIKAWDSDGEKKSSRWRSFVVDTSLDNDNETSMPSGATSQPPTDSLDNETSMPYGATSPSPSPPLTDMPSESPSPPPTDSLDDDTSMPSRAPSPPPVQPPTDALSFTYEPDASNFPNPERGFYASYDLMTEQWLGWIKDMGTGSITLAFAYIRLDDFRETVISQAMLDQIGFSLGLARDVGIKVIVRCSYNFPTGAEYMEAQDASLSRVVEHINQLQGVFSTNKDVILLFQAGFIGAWGEWHSSSNDLAEPGARRAVLEALWSTLPTDRMIQIRYPDYVIDEFPIPLESSQAFDESPQARTGHHNDCFLSSEDDVGTYWPVEDKPALQTYVASMAPFVFIGGETCNAGDYVRRYDCPSAMGEMERFQWDYINVGFNVEAIDTWKDEGCYETIATKLGYRYRLIQTEVAEVSAEALRVRITVTNDGWSSIKNPRGFNLVLRGMGNELKLCVDCWDTDADVRKWFPAPGQTETLDVLWNLPVGAETGLYELLLELPDPEISDRPEYSIRMANSNVWEESTGYNKLGSIDLL